MSIGGEKSVQKEFGKVVGFGEFEVLAFNPDKEELAEMGINFEKEPEYIAEKEGVRTARVTVWLRELKGRSHFSHTFFLEDKIAVSSKGTTQYLNSDGRSIYVDDAANLTEKFTAFPYHKARVGEVRLIEFLSSWLSINRDKPHSLEIEAVDWEALMSRGSVKFLRDLQKGDLPEAIVAQAIVKSVSSEDEYETNEKGEMIPVVKTYQNVYKKFLPKWCMKFFNNKSYTLAQVEEMRERKIKAKATGKNWPATHEMFMIDMCDPEYGIKDAFFLGPLKPYNPEEHLQGTTKTLDATDAEY